MSQSYEKLKSLLKELFQLDQSELDFGIYRIMNQKHDNIIQYLDKDISHKKWIYATNERIRKMPI